MRNTVVGLFDSLDRAREAVLDLQALGLPRNEISVVANNADNRYALADSADSATDGAIMGVEKGAIWGGVAGLMLGIGTFAVPGIGPVLAAGSWATALASALTGAGIGAVAGGLIYALVEAGVPDEHAHFYAEGIRRGGTLVVVKPSDDLAKRSAEILTTHGAINVDDGVASYRDAGFNRFDETLQPLTAEEIAANRQTLAALSRARQGDGTHARIYDEIGVDYSIPTMDTQASPGNEPLAVAANEESTREHAVLR